MTKGKYETHVLPHLKRIASWVRQGATEKEIAEKLSIAYSTFRRYIDLGRQGDERYAALSEAFAQACEIPDDQVEAALFRRACGYQYEEVTEEEKMDRDGSIHTVRKTVVKDVPANTQAQMFWLTNRRRDKWQYKPEQEDRDDDAGGMVVLAPVLPEDGVPDGAGGPGGGRRSSGVSEPSALAGGEGYETCDDVPEAPGEGGEG